MIVITIAWLYYVPTFYTQCTAANYLVIAKINTASLTCYFREKAIS
ncbi:MAG: hypothetical protein OEL84_08095 [Nitrosopumilus sp.]|nr:hypothetical protein [Nitrosopumilus sp.]